MPEVEIRRLMKHLGESINETLSDSPKIKDRIQEIRDAGYEVHLVIEARIGYRPASMEEGSATLAQEPVRLRITSDDVKFLKSLKISAEDLH